MPSKTHWLIIIIFLEVIFITLLGFILNYNLLNLSDFGHIYYIFGAIALIPFAYFLFKFREYDLIRGDIPTKLPINWIAIMTFLVPVIPLLIFSVVLVNLHLNYFVTQTILSLFVAIIGGVIDTAVLFGNFFRKHLIATAFAIIGLVLAFVFNQGNVASEYQFILATPFAFAAICIGLASVSIFKLEQRKKLVKLAGMDIVSFIFIFASFFTNNLLTNSTFSLSFKNLPQLFYNFLLTLGLALFIFTVFAFLSIILHLEDEKNESDYMGDKAYKINSEYLFSIDKNLTIIKDNFKYYLSFLPIWPTENLIVPEILEDLSENSILHWWDTGALKMNIFTGANKELIKSKKTMDDIHLLIKELNQLSEKVIKNYILFYREIEKINPDKILILGAFNTFMGYSKYYWPNIYNRIHKDKDLEFKFNELMNSTKNNVVIKKFILTVKNVKDFRAKVEGLDSE